MVHASDPSTQEAEGRESQIAGQTGLLDKSLSQKKKSDVSVIIAIREAQSEGSWLEANQPGQS
jgi:hypothetical protein